MKTKHCPHGWPEIHQCRQCTIWKLETECAELNKKYAALLEKHAELLDMHAKSLRCLEMAQGYEAR